MIDRKTLPAERLFCLSENLYSDTGLADAAGKRFSILPDLFANKKRHFLKHCFSIICPLHLSIFSNSNTLFLNFHRWRNMPVTGGELYLRRCSIPVLLIFQTGITEKVAEVLFKTKLT